MVDAISSSSVSTALLVKELLGLEKTTSSTDDDNTSAGGSTSSSSTTSLSQGDLATVFQQLATQIQATLIQQQDGGATSGGSQGPGPGGPPDFGSLFSKLDTNGDGTVTEAEFVDGRPKGVSEDQAKALWSKIDSSGASSLTKDQFVSGMEANPPPPPPGGGPGGSEASASDVTAAGSAGSSSLESLVENLLQVIDGGSSTATS